MFVGTNFWADIHASAYIYMPWTSLICSRCVIVFPRMLDTWLFLCISWLLWDLWSLWEDFATLFEELEPFGDFCEFFQRILWLLWGWGDCHPLPHCMRKSMHCDGWKDARIYNSRCIQNFDDSICPTWHVHDFSYQFLMLVLMAISICVLCLLLAPWLEKLAVHRRVTGMASSEQYAMSLGAQLFFWWKSVMPSFGCDS